MKQHSIHFISCFIKLASGKEFHFLCRVHMCFTIYVSASLCLCVCVCTLDDNHNSNNLIAAWVNAIIKGALEHTGAAKKKKKRNCPANPARDNTQQ